jgi:Tfp pilus assembly protein PilW
MKHLLLAKTEKGFSLMELVVCMAILIPVMGAAISLFSVGANQQTSEQGSIDVNQEARSALEMMTTEIAQAGSHGDRATTLAGGVSAVAGNERTVAVASGAGLSPGDWVDVGTGTGAESVKLTAVSSNGIGAVFENDHTSGEPVRLFALPYVTGVIPPAGLGASSSANVSTLRFFGDINGDSIVQYVEYAYDGANNQITRSITPISQTTLNQAIPFIKNVTPNSVQFTLTTDSRGIVTSVNIAMTVQNNWSLHTQNQRTRLSSRVTIPSAMAGSVLLHELRRYGGFDKLPPTPSRVTTWASYATQ